MIDSTAPGPDNTPPPVVLVKDLRVRYGKFEAVRGISFEIPKGEVFGFIGPNGAGKSSTIRVLATLQKQFEGTVRVNGINVRKDPDQVREMMGYVPDFFGVYDDLSAREYLHFFAAAYRIPRGRRPGLALGYALAHDIPFVLQEQNTHPGITAKFFSRFARQVHLGFPEARRQETVRVPIRRPRLRS